MYKKYVTEKTSRLLYNSSRITSKNDGTSNILDCKKALNIDDDSSRLVTVK